MAWLQQTQNEKGGTSGILRVMFGGFIYRRREQKQICDT